MTQPLTDLETRHRPQGAEGRESEKQPERDPDYEVHDSAFRHAGGTGPVLVFSVTPAKVLAFAKGTFGQTRHRFPSGMSATTRRR